MSHLRGCVRLLLVLLVAASALPASRADAGTVTIFAAASLTDAFRQIARDFAASHPGSKVEFNFAGSSTLVRQIGEGAPADVLACADEESMRKVAGELAGEPTVFARNRLAIVVPRGNPKHVQRLADLARAGMTIALAAPAVPAGRYAREAFARAGVPVPDSSGEADVRAVLTRVAMGEADAGVVYATDVAAADDVDGVAIPDEHNVLASYPIATLKAARDPDGARAFVAQVLSAAGRRVLADAGFLPP